MIYLDNAATTFPKPEIVYSSMDKTNRFCAVNAGRGSYKAAREASALISETKQLIRTMVKAESNKGVIFTPSITIALNQIIAGIRWNTGDVVYASPFEHNAVARTIHNVGKSFGITIKILPVNENSMEIDLERMKYEFSKDKPKAVFCTHISNVTGYILPVELIFAEAKKYGAYTVLDTAQSLGLIPVNSKTLQADIIAFAGHKSLYGPFGIGGFINISSVDLVPVIVGGTGSDSLNLEMPSGEETKYESSSTNIVAISGLNAALRELNQQEIFEHEKELTEYFLQEIKKIDGVKLFIPDKRENHIGIVSFSIPGILSEDVGTILDEDYNIAVRTGYHCAPWIHEYLQDESTKGTVRVGFGQYNTKQDIDCLIEALEEISE